VRFNGIPTSWAIHRPTQLNILFPDEPTIRVVALQEQGQLIQSNILAGDKAALSPGLFPLRAVCGGGSSGWNVLCAVGLLDGVRPHRRALARLSSCMHGFGASQSEDRCQ